MEEKTKKRSLKLKAACLNHYVIVTVTTHFVVFYPGLVCIKAVSAGVRGTLFYFIFFFFCNRRWGVNNESCSKRNQMFVFPIAMADSGSV